jgi:hypothetical protein
MHIQDPKRGVKRNPRLAIKRGKLVNVAALSHHTLKEEKEVYILVV